ncbi:hypothetical protein BHM03_00060108 [Ensete ventricosum]|nr:hypothetical protein BHM03_00060108 [Ensete ventricosum]
MEMRIQLIARVYPGISCDKFLEPIRDRSIWYGDFRQGGGSRIGDFVVLFRNRCWPPRIGLLRATGILNWSMGSLTKAQEVVAEEEWSREAVVYVNGVRRVLPDGLAHLTVLQYLRGM